MATRRASLSITAAACCLLALCGCEQIFTYTPFTFLQRPLESLTPEQQLQYGQDALESGDPAAMQDAYDVLSAETGSGDAQHLAAELAIELSGMSDFLLAVASGTALLPDPGNPSSLDAFNAFITDQIDVQLFIDAAGNLQNAQALGAELEPVDILMGGLGLVLDAAQQPDGTLDFTAMDAAELADANAFVTQDAVTEIINSLPADDGLRILLEGFQGYVAAL